MSDRKTLPRRAILAVLPGDWTTLDELVSLLTPYIDDVLAIRKFGQCRVVDRISADPGAFLSRARRYTVNHILTSLMRTTPQIGKRKERGVISYRLSSEGPESDK